MSRQRKQQAHVARKHHKAAKASKTPQGAFKGSHKRGAGKTKLDALQPSQMAFLQTPSPLMLLLDRRQKPQQGQGKVIPFPVFQSHRKASGE